jgi:hypothetical protein
MMFPTEARESKTKEALKLVAPASIRGQSPRRVTLVLAFATLAMAACSGNDNDGTSGQDTSSSEETQTSGLSVSREEFGGDWPLTVDEGTLNCEGAAEVGAVTFTAPNGVTYAVNGLAIGQDRWPEIDAIWADNPDIPGTKKNIGPLIDRGLELCDG